MWDEEQKIQLYERILAGSIGVYNLPVSLYEDIGKTIESSIYKGYGGSLVDFDLKSPDYDTLIRMKKNTYVFSAAKTFQQVNDIQKHVYDEQGFKRGFTDFKRKADNIFEQYNVNYLKTEQETAVATAQNARKWNEQQRNKDVAPYLRYVTVGDQRVRPSHADLGGIVKHIDDPFWDQFYPPNGWACRCEALSDSGDNVPGETGLQPLGDRYMRKDTGAVIQKNPKLFQMNPGRDKYIFNETVHPYMKVSQRFRVHKKKNFGLPLPKDTRGLKRQVRRTREIKR